MTEHDVLRALLSGRIVPVVVLEEARDGGAGGVGPRRGRAAGRRGHLPDGGRRRLRSGASPTRQTFSSEPAPSCGRSRSTRRSTAGARFIVTPGLSLRGDRAVPGARRARDPRRGDRDRGDRRARPGARPAQALPGRGGRRRRAPARASRAVPRRALRPDGWDQRRERRVLPRAAVRGGGGRQLDGGTRADRGDGTSPPSRRLAREAATLAAEVAR